MDARADVDPEENDELPTIELSDSAVDALRRAVDLHPETKEKADSGDATAIDADAFHVMQTPDGYTLEIDGKQYADLSTDELVAIAREHPIAVSNWYFHEHVVDDDGPRGSFLRWLEGIAPVTGADDPTGEAGDSTAEADDEEARDPAPRDRARTLHDRYAAMNDGLVREWGQLRIETTLAADGTRRYEIRHVDAANMDRDHLEERQEPVAAREIAKYDETERYRPLKTAPSLPTGWVFPALDAHECYETVETFYPATIPNWYREARGELDVTHWHEAIERQTGIYGLIETWDRGEGHEHVEWVAETCCDDSQCLKRREWDYDAETPLAVDAGDGTFPCREPCSLVISAARQWTKLEGEAERTYEFELTPSEKEQIEAIIDAVADGRTPEIREADVYEGANRYRTRFLRAKRFDENGNLCGVATDPDEE
ncbi:DR2241 family protein [Halopenitus sp. H-Gu1]|uniref:DR2241 family protein n=1 Tax=Halopenitus sp. H-Gu1 TaxID=3242697 RepID=UPI00359E06F9